MTFEEIQAVNTAAKAMGLGLAGMTQERWNALSEVDRARLVDTSGLCPQLIAYEGCRVEVIDLSGNRRRFWVGRSAGWRPCSIELMRTDSKGGRPADERYARVTLTSAERW